MRLKLHVSHLILEAFLLTKNLIYFPKAMNMIKNRDPNRDIVDITASLCSTPFDLNVPLT